MLLCRVTGSTVVTVRAGGLGGAKLLVVRPECCDGAGCGGGAAECCGCGPPFVAVDTVGAGSGDLVLVAQGSAARVPGETASAPTDAAVVGIVDEASHDPGG